MRMIRRAVVKMVEFFYVNNSAPGATCYHSTDNKAARPAKADPRGLNFLRRPQMINWFELAKEICYGKKPKPEDEVVGDNFPCQDDRAEYEAREIKAMREDE